MAKKKTKRKRKRKVKGAMRRRRVSKRPKRAARRKARAHKAKPRKAKSSKAKSRKARAHKRHPVRARRKVAQAVKKRPPKKIVDPRVARAVKQYEEAMRQFGRQSFRRAKDIFEKVVTGPSRELAERARVHVAICEQRLQRAAPVSLRTADDHYHYAVSQINLSNYEDARTHLQKARKLAPKADFIYYALASVAALTGEAEEAFEHLEQAIKLRPENRYQVRNDTDFKLLEDDPRFLELAYPEGPPATGLGRLHT
ncbi:MAG: hypothetical protein ACE5HB_04205 [Terriglobia bacterium]